MGSVNIECSFVDAGEGQNLTFNHGLDAVGQFNEHRVGIAH